MISPLYKGKWGNKKLSLYREKWVVFTHYIKGECGKITGGNVTLY